MMPVSIQDALDDLYRLTVTERKSTSTRRLSVLGDYCIQELAARGLEGAESEQVIPGGGRSKTWDIVWRYDGKVRLAISLKSLLRNLPGTVPNRIDDLMGEAANAQLYSPEIVIGYVMVFDIGADASSKKHGQTWLELLRSRLTTLSGRRPPAWTIGTIEAFVIAEVDFARSPALLSNPDDFSAFFDALVSQVIGRNPNVLGPDGVP
jgi:hypothetical protein